MPEMIVGARSWITVPAPPVLGGGVLSVANVIDNPDVHALMGAQYETDACADVTEWDEWCTMSPVAAKLFDNASDVVEGDPFMLYAGVSCDVQRVDEARTRVQARFAYAEGRGVDRNVVAALEAGTLTDLGGPFGVDQAIGVAEAYAATVYGGVPTLLIPRQFVCCAGPGAIYRGLDGALTTCQGALVANITAPIGTPALDAGTIYVTGQITLLRGPLNVISVPQQPTTSGAYEPARALAERIYVPLFDCFAAQVAVSCS